MENIFNYVDINVSEKQFETDIERSLLDHGYLKINHTLFNKETMLFDNIFVEFVKSSQPKSWERYVKFYGNEAAEKLVRRLNDSIESRGVLDVLKNGFSDMGINITVCFSKPESSLNEDLNEKYTKNIIGETRQFFYSKQNNNSIDMVLSINGIPIFAYELKNQFMGQDYQCAINQWKNDRDPKEQIFKFNKRFLAYFAVDLYET